MSREPIGGQILELEQMDTLSNIGMILELLQCPECRQGRLAFEQPEATLRCDHCGECYQVQHGILANNRPSSDAQRTRRRWAEAFGGITMTAS